MLPDLRPEPTIRAKIRSGIKVNGFPRADDKFHSLDPDFCSTLGSPNELVISIPFNDPEDAFRTALEYWAGPGKLRCYCQDTKTAHALDRTGAWVEGACAYKGCKFWNVPQPKPSCRPVGRLRFCVPQLSPNAIWQYDTSSWHTIKGIVGLLNHMAPIEPTQLFKAKMVKKKGPERTFFILTLQPIDTPEDADA